MPHRHVLRGAPPTRARRDGCRRAARGLPARIQSDAASERATRSTRRVPRSDGVAALAALVAGEGVEPLLPFPAPAYEAGQPTRARPRDKSVRPRGHLVKSPRRHSNPALRFTKAACRHLHFRGRLRASAAPLDFGAYEKPSSLRSTVPSRRRRRRDLVLGLRQDGLDVARRRRGRGSRCRILRRPGRWRRRQLVGSERLAAEHRAELESA